MATKEKNIEIYNDTLDRVLSFEHRPEKEVSEMMKNTKFYIKAINTGFQKKYNTEINVINMDCMVAAGKEVYNGNKTAMLNMASAYMPGGGVFKGSNAQEEAIFRRSDLCMSLYQFHSVADDFDEINRHPKYHYPLHKEYGGIYTPNVMIFKDGSYNLLDDPFECNVVSVAAINLRREGDIYLDDINNYNSVNTAWEKTMSNKIETILSICAENYNDTLILGAFGCGAFANNPVTVATLFKKLLTSEKWNGVFKKVIFAIIEDANSNGKNFNAFNTVFKN